MKSDQETLIFEIGVVCVYLHIKPKMQLSIDKESISCTLDQGQNMIVFSKDLSFGAHELSIQKTGSSIFDASQMIIIDQIKIDGIDCQNFIWNSSRFCPVYPEPWASQQHELGVILQKNIVGETHLGHDGIWTLEFKSPFYQFLIDRSI